ncbi:MAG: acyl-CoA synthetase FdrA [Chloroflexota bacterium]
MTITLSQIRPGAYYDSVVLMQLQKGLAALPGVADAGVVMGTAANQALLKESDLLLPEATAARPDDLLIVVRAESEALAASALAQVDSLLQKRRGQPGSSQGTGPGDWPAYRPRSLVAALKALPAAQWVLVSLPGRYAASVAQEALNLGRHVFLYSDNVALADEVALKHEARQKGLLVMGPDCGTAIVNGVGLGFANRVRRGWIGLVGASGTGLQAITSHIHNLGGGVSQAIGTGGRDLKAEVGGVTAHQSLDLLARDEATQVIILVSKPPAPEVAARLLAAAQAVGKPVVLYFIGQPPPGRQIGNVTFATSLREAAELAVTGNWQLVRDNDQSPITNYLLPGFVRGLFSGGTLAYEAVVGLQAVLAPLYTNVPITEAQRLPDSLRSQAHAILDLGADEFTVGRLHPMMDNDLRLRKLRQEAADPDVSLILLDVVLGEGAHPDPAAELAPAVAQALASRGSADAAQLECVVIVVGTDDDPQGLTGQVERLAQAGATVFRSVDEAVDHVARRFAHPVKDAHPPVNLDTLRAPLAAVNVGLEMFYDSLIAQGAAAVQVEWRPPAGGNEKLMALLAKMKRPMD